jgi:hypothetical protein
MLINTCDNCSLVIGPKTCDAYASHRAGKTDCVNAYHYLGASPRDLPNASRHEPAVLCGTCLRLLRGHRTDELEERAGF